MYFRLGFVFSSPPLEQKVCGLQLTGWLLLHSHLSNSQEPAKTHCGVQLPQFRILLTKLYEEMSLLKTPSIVGGHSIVPRGQMGCSAVYCGSLLAETSSVGQLTCLLLSKITFNM